MFYAAAFNNAPQQIGLAVSNDGIHWQRCSDKPFLTNGLPGEWNESESGHPCVYRDKQGQTHLFYQGNNTKGKNWMLTSVPLKWTKQGPQVRTDNRKSGNLSKGIIVVEHYDLGDFPL